MSDWLFVLLVVVGVVGMSPVVVYFFTRLITYGYLQTVDDYYEEKEHFNGKE